MLKRKLFRIFETVGVLAASALLIIYPRESSAAAANALDTCIRTLIPSLFPFFVLSGIMRLPEKFAAPLTSRLFRVGGACAAPILTGLVSGYPVGAASAVSLYREGRCSKDEAERLIAFCNNAGPAFIFGVVGVSVFKSSRAALLLYVVNAIVSLTVGAVLGTGHRAAYSPPSSPSRAPGFTASVKTAVSSVLNVSAFVIFFAVYIKLAGMYIHFSSPILESLLTGFVELSSGLMSLDGFTPLNAALASAMLGWGGISVHCQVLSFTSDTDLSLKRYFLARLAHGVLCACVTYTICKIMWK